MKRRTERGREKETTKGCRGMEEKVKGEKNEGRGTKAERWRKRIKKRWRREKRKSKGRGLEEEDK